MPPPTTTAVLKVMVLSFLSLSVAKVPFTAPPPTCVAELLLSVEWLSVTMPSLKMPPSFSAELPLT